MRFIHCPLPLFFGKGRNPRMLLVWDTRKLNIEEVLYQPEAAGDYHLYPHVGAIGSRPETRERERMKKSLLENKNSVS